jgi:hypothetical protein
MLDAPTVRDTDPGFVGFASRLNPSTFPSGVLQVSENMRLERGTAQTRKGVKRVADNILTPQAPLSVPFKFAPTLPLLLNFFVPNHPSGVVVADSYTGGVFASCVFKSPNLSVGENIILAGRDRAFVWRDRGPDELAALPGMDVVTDSSDDPLQVTMVPEELSYPAGETIEDTDTVSMLQAFDRVYLLREASQEVGEFGLIPVQRITVSGTTATVVAPGHGYVAGQRVRIEEGTVAAFNGHEFDVVAETADSFTVTVPNATAASGPCRMRRVKAPLFWDTTSAAFVRSPGGVPSAGPTYRTLRSAGWATYTNGRLVIPDGPDTVALSDILEPNLYDPYWQTFRANQGSNDTLVAVHPWVEGSFLVFMRKSIWLAEVNQAYGATGAVGAVDTVVSRLQMLTDEIGCVARRSIATAGQFVYFLSDSGVYRLDARLDLKLRGDTKPLSDPIADQFDALNYNYADRSVGLWHDNRYWLAVPTGTYEQNVSLFIYSALNEAWETKDIHGYGIDNLLVSAYGRERRVFVPNRHGRLFLLDEREDGDDSPDSIANEVSAVPGRLVTRRYGFNNPHNKRFTRVLSDAVLPDTAAITVKARMINPDAEITLVPGQTNTSGLAEDYTLKQPIRQKAHYCEIEFLTTANRPEIRTVSVEGTASNMPQTETRNAA